MTREENIRAILESNFASCRDELIDIAVNRIIELEDKPCEDCISRQATLEPYKNLKDDDVIAIWLIKKNIEQQNSVMPKCPPQDEQNICHCVYCPIKKAEDKMLVCPNCGLDVHSDFKYCPRCGADMRGEKNETDN